jgi:DICT domain-containing protein
MTETEWIEAIVYRLLDLIEKRNTGQHVKPQLEALAHDLEGNVRATQEELVAIRFQRGKREAA